MATRSLSFPISGTTPPQEGDIKRVPIVDTNAAQDADEIIAFANLEYSKEQVRPLSGDQ